MSSKRQNTKKTKARKTPSVSAKDVQTQMQLLGFVRSKDTFLALLTSMQSVDQELKAAYDYLHTCKTGSLDEGDCLLRIRQLEDRRFQLLSNLHGNRVNDYHILSTNPSRSK